MTKQRSADPDAPPTAFEDWQHAHVRRPTRMRPPKPPVSGGLTFHVYQASNEKRLFVVTDGRDPSGLVDCPKGLWIPLKVFRETGDARIGLSEAEAREDIRRQGFHLIDLDKRLATSRRLTTAKRGLADGAGRFKKKTPAPRPPKRRASR